MKKIRITKPDILKDKRIIEEMKKREEKIAPQSLETISRDTGNHIRDNETILRLFPEVDLAIQILVSSITSPNDLVTNEINFHTESDFIPSSLRTLLLSVVKDDVNSIYELEDDIANIIRRFKYTEGAVAKLLIPEAAINSVLGLNVTAGLESNVDYIVKKESYKPIINLSKEERVIDRLLCEEISITDSPAPIATDVIVSNMVGLEDDKNVIITSGNESEETIDKQSLIEKIMAEQDVESNFVYLSQPETEDNKGRPLIMDIPIESVVPIHSKTDKSKHMGYFILLDADGTPIKRNSNQISEDKDKLRIETAIVRKAKKNLGDKLSSAPTVKNMESVFTSLMNKKLFKLIQDKTKTGFISREEQNEIYKTLYSRALSKMKTRIIFVPSSMLTYFAVDFRENGTGKSELEKLSTLSSIRSILLFSRIMAIVSNNIPLTHVHGKLDENDPLPKKTMERIIAEASKMKTNKLPIGIGGISDLVSWTHDMGLSYSFEHPSLPDMEISTETKSADKHEPDGTLEETLQKQMIMLLGLPVEMVLDTTSPEFATQIVSDNSLFMRRVSTDQKPINKLTTRYTQNIIRNDNVLYSKIKDLIEANISKVKKKLSKELKEEFTTKGITDEDITIFALNDFIKTLKVTLPKPLIKEDNENTKERFKEFSDMVEETLTYYLSSEALPNELFGELSDDLDTFKDAAKNTILRKWLADHRVIEEVSDILTYDDEGKPQMDVFEDYGNFTEAIAKALYPFLKNNEEKREMLERKFGNLLGDEEEEVEEEVTEDGDIKSEDDTTEENEDPIEEVE